MTNVFVGICEIFFLRNRILLKYNHHAFVVKFENYSVINESSALTMDKPLKRSTGVFKLLCVWETCFKIHSNEKCHQYRFFEGNF